MIGFQRLHDMDGWRFALGPLLSFGGGTIGRAFGGRKLKGGHVTLFGRALHLYWASDNGCALIVRLLRGWKWRVENRPWGWGFTRYGYVPLKYSRF